MSHPLVPLQRYSGNPIITPAQMPFPCSAVFNAGVVKFKGKILLLLRVEDLQRETVFVKATSADGIHFDIDPTPINYPLGEVEKGSERKHRFDMRITPIDGTYYICHAIWLDKFGSVLGIAKTDDFVNFQQISISVPSNRNGVLFPEKINGLYARLERPQHIDGKGHIWISYSPDLVYWGNPKPLPMPRLAWGEVKTGAGAVPIKTDKGWLEIYHATAFTASTENYYLGAMLLDLKDPSKIIAAPKHMILAAERDYECVGQVPNVVFTGGAIETDGGKLYIYYGGADTRMCIAESTVGTLVDFCLNNK